METRLGQRAGMSPEALASVAYDQTVEDPRFTTCFICNRQMEPMKIGPAICWANDRTSEGDHDLWLVLAHPACIERVAHREFDLDQQRGRLDER